MRKVYGYGDHGGLTFAMYSVCGWMTIWIQMACYLRGSVIRKTCYPGRHIIPEGMLSRKVYYPVRHAIPEGILSRKAYYPKRCVISEGK